MGRAMGDVRDVCNNDFYDYLYELFLIKASVVSSLTLIIIYFYFWFSFFSYGLLV